MGQSTPIKIMRGRAAVEARTRASTNTTCSSISSITGDSSNTGRVLRSNSGAMLVSPFDSGVSSDIEDGDELDDEDDCNIVFAAEEEISDDESVDDKDNDEEILPPIQEIRTSLKFCNDYLIAMKLAFNDINKKMGQQQ